MSNDQQKKPEADGDVLFVLDANHKTGTPAREHEIPIEWNPQTKEVVRTKRYQLTSDPEHATAMPREHAMKFVSDPAFIVLDKDGNRVKPIRKRNMLAIGKALGLDEDETVCEYAEMTKEALFKRAQTYPGGELLKPSDPKELLINFLKEHQQLAAQIGVARGSEDVDAQLAAAGGKLPDHLAQKLVDAPRGAIAEVMKRQQQERERRTATA